MKAIDYLSIKSLPFVNVFLYLFLRLFISVILYLVEIAGSSFHCFSTFIETLKIRRHLLGVTNLPLKIFRYPHADCRKPHRHI